MKNKLISCIFLLIVFGGAILFLLTPDNAVSYGERRNLRQFPTPTAQTVLNGRWMRDYEEYLLDQFPMRDSFRKLKAGTLTYIFRQLDYNGLYRGEGGHILKPVYPLDESSVTRLATRLNGLYREHFINANAYYAIIPDKSQYSAIAASRLRLDYERMVELANMSIRDETRFIPLYDSLTLDDYYITDLHWRQERLERVVNRLGEYMGFTMDMSGLEEYKFSPFYGAYFGQYALSAQTDTLIYLTSDTINAAYVDDLENPDRHGVYAEDKLHGMDAYDVFLNGATPLITITNKSAQNGRSLVIFRDSFASSLAPLIIPAYERITLVDLRYMSSALIGELIDTEVDDVLFIFGEQLINQSAVLR